MHYTMFLSRDSGELERNEVSEFLWFVEKVRALNTDYILRQCAQCIFSTLLTFLEHNFKVQRDEPLSAQYVFLCCFTSPLYARYFSAFLPKSKAMMR